MGPPYWPFPAIQTWGPGLAMRALPMSIKASLNFARLQRGACSHTALSESLTKQSQGSGSTGPTSFLLSPSLLTLRQQEAFRIKHPSTGKPRAEAFTYTHLNLTPFLYLTYTRQR